MPDKTKTFKLYLLPSSARDLRDEEPEYLHHDDKGCYIIVTTNIDGEGPLHLIKGE